jgi:hypothetical protein
MKGKTPASRSRKRAGKDNPAYTMAGMRAQAAFAVACLSGALAVRARAVAAAELPDAVIRLTRGAGAESCPPETDLVRSVTAQARVSPGERGPSKPVVDVTMERYGDAYFATIRVDGGARGVRTIQGEGPTCDALRDAVVLALLVLLEREAESAPAPTAQAPPDPAPVTERTHVFASAGGAVTFAEPLDVFVAAMGGAGVTVGPWAAGAVFQWSPPRRVENERGAVDVQAWGGILRLCYALPLRSAVRLSGCGLGSLFALRGQGRGLDDEKLQVRPWWRAGGGVEAEFPLGPRVALGAFANVFGTLAKETFSVGGLGVVYETSAVTGHVGAELRLRLF